MFMDLLTQYYGILIFAAVAVTAFFVIGKKKSVELIKTIAYEVGDQVGNHIIANKEKYTELVYAKIPAKFKIFISKKMVEKIVVEVAQIIDPNDTNGSDLDK
ncbi:hypothetical protein D3C71_983950 [compost metagenome]